MKIGVVGMGSMGSAIFDKLKANNYEVSGCDHNYDINDFLTKCDVFIIAVKPQDFELMAGEIKIDLSEKIALSIMAGKSIRKISEILRMKKVIRTIPNLPLKVGRGLTGFIAGNEVSMKEKKYIREILELFGEAIEVQDEKKIDLICALAGSGPAYFALFTELLQNYAFKNGFSSEESEKIATMTFLGSAKLMKKMAWSPEEMRKKITSKKGTTDAAITKMLELNIENIFYKGIDAAVKRSGDLNK